jgi:hypothetical protein
MDDVRIIGKRKKEHPVPSRLVDCAAQNLQECPCGNNPNIFTTTRNWSPLNMSDGKQDEAMSFIRSGSAIYYIRIKLSPL